MKVFLARPAGLQVVFDLMCCSGLLISNASKSLTAATIILMKEISFPGSAMGQVW